MHQQQLAAASMLPGMAGLGSISMNNPAAAAAAAAMAMNPMAAMAAAAAGMKQEDAMNATAIFNNFIKNSGTNLSSGILPGLASGIAPNSNNAAIGGNGALAPGFPSTSSASVPPLGAGIDETVARLSASVNSTRAASASRPRSSAGSPSISNFFFFKLIPFFFADNLNSSLRSGTPLLKRTKIELDENDGELEIDVQNDDASGIASSSGFNGSNGNLNHPTSRNKDGGRESTQSATSSRDSPRSGKQVKFI